MEITNFLVMNSLGEEIPADAFESNLAFLCGNCGHPLLAMALENQRGSSTQHPVSCRGCGKAFFLDVRKGAQKIYIHEM